MIYTPHHIKGNAHALWYKYLYIIFFLPVQIFFLMGIPAVLTMDQGSEFKNQLNSHLMQQLGISHRLTSQWTSGTVQPDPHSHAEQGFDREQGFLGRESTRDCIHIQYISTGRK